MTVLDELWNAEQTPAAISAAVGQLNTGVGLVYINYMTYGLCHVGYYDVQCESKNPPCGFLTFFPKWLRIFNQFLHTYYMLPSTLDYKFLLNYLQL